MNQVRLGILGAPLVITIGCTPLSARLETSEAPPVAVAPDPPVAYAPPVAHLPSSFAHLQRASEGFFLALETQSSAQLDDLLTKDALLRRQTGGATTPALAGLLEISGAWSADSAVNPGVLAPKKSTFGPVTIVEMHTDPETSWITVNVDRPAAVQGRWKIRFNENGPKPLIQEVVLPSDR